MFQRLRSSITLAIWKPSTRQIRSGWPVVDLPVPLDPDLENAARGLSHALWLLFFWPPTRARLSCSPCCPVWALGLYAPRPLSPLVSQLLVLCGSLALYVGGPLFSVALGSARCSLRSHVSRRSASAAGDAPRVSGIACAHHRASAPSSMRSPCARSPFGHRRAHALAHALLRLSRNARLLDVVRFLSAKGDPPLAWLLQVELASPALALLLQDQLPCLWNQWNQWNLLVLPPSTPNALDAPQLDSVARPSLTPLRLADLSKCAPQWWLPAASSHSSHRSAHSSAHKLRQFPKGSCTALVLQ